MSFAKGSKDNDFFGVISLYLPSNPRRINEYEIEDPSLAMSSRVNTLKYRNCNIFYKIMLPSIWIDALIGNPDNEDINSPLIWSANKNKIFAKIVEFDGYEFEKISNFYINKIIKRS